jgi:hypothetical protein
MLWIGEAKSKLLPWEGKFKQAIFHVRHPIESGMSRKLPASKTAAATKPNASGWVL